MIAYLPPPAMIEHAKPAPASIQADFYAQIARGLEETRLTFADFMRQSWHVIEPARPFMENWHLGAIAEHLTAVRMGQITRLIINGPPRLGKSIPVSVQFPAWLWTEMPSSRIIGASYAGDLATKHNVDRRDIILSEWYQSRWGRKFQLTGDQNLKREFTNTARGHMIARGTGGGITGYGADGEICDDLLNPKLADSDIERAAVIDYFDGTLYSRLDDKKRGWIIVNEQRLHAKDLTAHLLKNGEPWVHLVLPAVESIKRIIVMPVSKTEIVREAGDALWPARENQETLTKVKLAMGSRRFGAQYLQAPTESDGKILKRTYWKFYRELPTRIVEGKKERVPFEQVLQSWDMAFKGLADSDFVVGQVWGKIAADRYLLDQVRDRMGFKETVAAVRSLTAKWPQAHMKLIEDKANGAAVMDTLGNEIGGIVAVNPEGGKIVRVHAVEPYAEAGNIWLPHPDIAPWVNDFIEECAAFPEGDNDDQVDAFSQANAHFNGEAVPGLFVG